MKIFLTIIFICCNVETSFALTNRELAAQIAAKARQQQILLDQTLASLDDSRNTATALAEQLTTAQSQINQVGTERDQWHTYGDAEHEKVMKSAVTIQKQTAAILRRNILIGVMLLCMAAYGVAKFYFHVPFL
jgi:hypothetical protein